MPITIRRSTGHIGGAGKIHIIINGKKVAAINENQSLEIELPYDGSILKVKQFGIRSNEIEVREGDVLEIKHRRWHLMILPLMIAFNFLIIFFPGTSYTSTILPIHVLFLITVFGTKGYSIRCTNIDD